MTIRPFQHPCILDARKFSHAHTKTCDFLRVKNSGPRANCGRSNQLLEFTLWWKGGRIN